MELELWTWKGYFCLYFLSAVVDQFTWCINLGFMWQEVAVPMSVLREDVGIRDNDQSNSDIVNICIINIAFTRIAFLCSLSTNWSVNEIVFVLKHLLPLY